MTKSFSLSYIIQLIQIGLQLQGCMGMIKNFLLFNLKRLGLKIPAEAATGTHTEGHLYHTRQLAKTCYSLTPREKSNVLQSRHQISAEIFLCPTYSSPTTSSTINSFLYLSCFPDTSIMLEEIKVLNCGTQQVSETSKKINLNAQILHAVSAYPPLLLVWSKLLSQEPFYSLLLFLCKRCSRFFSVLF